jgi:hypothetical protein
MENDFSNVQIFTGKELESSKTQHASAVEVEQSRAIAETQASMLIAKRFPRDQFQAYSRIMEACKRPSLASAAQYAFPRGNSMVTGPTIRLAEVLANAWGNIQSGIIELSRGNGFSEVMAYAADLETNTRTVRQFQVKHVRDTKQGSRALEGERDIYEAVANQGARRLRACILSVIPGDIVEAAEKKCEETLKKGGEPLEDRIRKMVSTFAEHGVTVEMLEKRLMHKMDATIVQELISLGKIYQSLRDGMAKREDFFEVAPTVETSNVPTEAEEKAKRHRRTKAEMEATKIPEAPVPPNREKSDTVALLNDPTIIAYINDFQSSTELKDWATDNKELMHEAPAIKQAFVARFDYLVACEANT